MNALFFLPSSQKPAHFSQCASNNMQQVLTRAITIIVNSRQNSRKLNLITMRIWKKSSVWYSFADDLAQYICLKYIYIFFFLLDHL